MSQLSYERMQRVRELSYRYLDWRTLLQDYEILGVQNLDTQLLFACPFHPDKRPSFRIRLDQHDCKCFSCGFYGRVIDFAYALSGKRVSQSVYFDNFLKANPGMQQELGFKSVFIEGKQLDENFNTRRTFSVNQRTSSDIPYSVLRSKVRKQSDTWESLVFSLTLLQTGVTAGEVLDKVSTVFKSEKEVKKVSLASLIDD